MFVAARDPAAAGRWAYKLEHLLPGKLTHKLAGRAVEVRRRPRGRAHAEAAGAGLVVVVSVMALDRARYLGRDTGVWHRHAVYGLVSADRAAHRRRVGADSGRRWRIRSGGADWADVVLCGAERSRGGRGAGAARGLAAADDRAGFPVRDSGRTGFGGMRNLAHAAADELRRSGDRRFPDDGDC